MTAGTLAGKTALITGGAAGIGRAVAERLAADGARIVIADRDEHGARSAAAELDDARSVAVDVADENSVATAFAELRGAEWTPDVVVASAGIQMFGADSPVADLDLETWRRTIDVNLTGAFLTLKYAVRGMLEQGGGSIILVGSPTALNGEGAAFTAYSASKAGAHGMARAVAAAYADRGIRCNIVVPGYTETGLVSAITEDPEGRAAIIGRIPLGRAGQPRDVAGMISFLASDDGAFATGATFRIDGGMTTL
ncbi:SDR family NAD(P)-dependent oxidoreductase [Microbacterium phyllosphaerae]|uniref:SDR family NAD(P)-dependent oxidoreductase n=1 Tax=Microbacterium phyllosphaerae TaxID=124798 RepID=UPI000EA2D0FB|nr:SDR family NAD(P)-dependent oxidoreductase [Microbacterium phyllosphaerae]